MKEANSCMDVHCQEALLELDTMLQESHAYHIARGPRGSDPRLYWYLPAYKLSLRHPSRVFAWLRKAEGLVIRMVPGFLRLYQSLMRIPNEVLSPYGLALFVQAYVRMYSRAGDPAYLELVNRYSSMLVDSLVRTESGNLGVGNPLEPPSEVNLPAGSEAVFALLDAYDLTEHERYLECAKRIAGSFVTDFEQKRQSDGSICLDYTVGGDGRYVLNANALAAAALVRVSSVTGERGYDEVVSGIMKYLYPHFSERRPLPYAGVQDGVSGKSYDVYHTGFTIRGVSEVLRCSDTLGNDWKSLLDERVESMRRDFLTSRGLIRVKVTRPTIIDIHGVAEYVRCLAETDFRTSDIPVFMSNLRHMRRGGGFYYQRGTFPSFVYMPRWGHAPAMLAMVTLIVRIERHVTGEVW